MNNSRQTSARKLTVNPQGERLESRTVFSGNALVEPLSQVESFGDSDEWSLEAINAPQAWAENFTGAGVVVAVLDTGVATMHPDLIASIWQNAGEVEGNGIDDDGNGYVDDVHGWDFVDDDVTTNDAYGHGTHVAGIIAAAPNDLGSTGVAFDATIMPVRVLDSQGAGSQLDIANGIRYAVRNGADIINLSLGGAGTQRIATAIEYARSEGVFIVAATGNAGAEMPDYPARFSESYDNVLSVGAFTYQREIASFSNDVGKSGAIQVDAPGVGVYGTSASGGYRYSSGTSVAAPHVTGIAALALSANPNMSPADLREAIVSAATTEVSGSDSIGGVDALGTMTLVTAQLDTNSSPPTTVIETPVVQNPFTVAPLTDLPDTQPNTEEPESSPVDPSLENSPPTVTPDAPENGSEANGDEDDDPLSRRPRGEETPDESTQSEPQSEPVESETPTPETVPGSQESAPLLGDANSNGHVDFTDFLAVARNFGTDVDGLANGDLNADGHVDFSDFLVLARNFGNQAEASGDTVTAQAIEAVVGELTESLNWIDNVDSVSND